MMLAAILKVFILFAFHTIIISGHPQCLDYLPPFTSARPQGLCKETSRYGCCTSSREKTLQSLYEYAMKISKKNGGPDGCDGFIRQVICAECNPYAAHVFDAETSPVQKSNFSKKSERFPGLCFQFCMTTFDSCRDLLLRLPWNGNFRSFIQSADEKDFCEWAIPADKDYCIPQVTDFKTIMIPRETDNENSKIMCVQPILHYFSNPLIAVSANDGTNRLFVGEQRGLIYIVDSDGALQSKIPFLDMRSKILNSGQPWDERGFLGLAFHPKFSNNGRFFVYYSVPDKVEDNKRNETEDDERHWYDSPKHKIRISEFLVSHSDANIADLESEIVILEVEEPEANHEGGMILFGDDGYLYVFIGDGGGAGDKHGSVGNALNMTSLLGKVLRLDVDVYDGRRYTIPPDNPFIKTNNFRPEIYAYGSRNMWRCSKDRGDPKTGYGKGRIFCGDVGQNKFEEIDIIVSGGNYGWRAMEGDDCYDSSLCKSRIMKNYQPPIIVYNHTVGKSIVGGYVYRGCQNPNIQGNYFYADTISSRIFMAKEDQETGKWNSREIVMGNQSLCNNALQGKFAPHILSFGEDEAGELYFTSVYWPAASKPYGTLYKLTDPTRRSDPETCKFVPTFPKILKKIQKRKIDGSQSVSGEYVKPKVPCMDTKRFCSYMKSVPWLCKKYAKLGQRFCKKSCKHCSR